jgi:hypothetical protein
MRDLKNQIYFTVHGAKKSVQQLADEIGISASYLYRASLESDESGCRFPLDLLLPLMHAAGDYRILDHLTNRCGRVTTSLPRVAKLKRKDPQTINEIQRNFNAVMAKVLEFYQNPERTRISEIEAELHAHLCEVAALKRSVADFHQGELL